MAILMVYDGRSGEYNKGYMKIKSNSDDDLPLNTVLNFCALTIIIRNVSEKEGKYYPQICF